MFIIYSVFRVRNLYSFGDCKYPVFYGRLPFWGSAQLHQKISNIFGNYAQIHQQISNIFGTYAQIHQQICKYLFGECQLPNYTNCNYICMCFFWTPALLGIRPITQKKLPNYHILGSPFKLPNYHILGSPFPIWLAHLESYNPAQPAQAAVLSAPLAVYCCVLPTIPNVTTPPKCPSHSLLPPPSSCRAASPAWPTTSSSLADTRAPSS